MLFERALADKIWALRVVWELTGFVGEDKAAWW